MGMLVVAQNQSRGDSELICGRGQVQSCCVLVTVAALSMAEASSKLYLPGQIRPEHGSQGPLETAVPSALVVFVANLCPVHGTGRMLVVDAAKPRKCLLRAPTFRGGSPLQRSAICYHELRKLRDGLLGCSGYVVVAAVGVVGVCRVMVREAVRS
jgi:hypothetical protein